MAVPYTFSTATSPIPLANLDANFNTPVTLGNTAVYLGSTTTTVNGLTLSNVAITSCTNAPVARQAMNSVGYTGITGSVITVGGTTAERDASPAGGYFRYNTTIGNFEGYTASGWTAFTNTLTVGTSVQTGANASTITVASTVINPIPPSVNRITLVFNQTSCTGTDDLLIQFGTASGGYFTTGYQSSGGIVANAAATAVRSSTTGFIVALGNAARAFIGTVTFNRINAAGNIWVSSHSGRCDTTISNIGGGQLQLGPGTPINAIRLIFTSTGLFDGGDVNIFYE